MEKREIGFCWGSRENLISTTKPTLRVATFSQRKRFHEKSSSLEVRYEPRWAWVFPGTAREGR
jgi:hypothetical protein